MSGESAVDGAVVMAERGCRNRRSASSVRTLTVEFDEQKEWVRHFKAPRQSTLNLHRGEEQLWFSVAETRADRIVNEILAAAGRE